VERSFAHEIAGLPRALNVSVLELELHTQGHVSGVGALVLEMLMICPVHTLELVLLDDLVILFCSLFSCIFCKFHQFISISK
jgi:hypothetical protein